jgi:histidyl-tRNA synthetase
MLERLRGRLPGLRATLHCGGGSFKSQLKRADRSGARVALVIGEAERAAGTVGIKALREEGVQESVPADGLADALLARFGEQLL